MAGSFPNFAECSVMPLTMCTPKSPLVCSSPLELRYSTVAPMNV